MSRSYFEEGNLSTRMLCYFGNTDDLFVDTSLFPQDIEHSLHRQLTSNGYERIVFYGGAKGAWFLDRKSKDLWDGKKPEAPVQSPVLGQSPLRGRIRPRGSAGGPQKEEPLAYRVDAAEMLRYTERFVKDTDIKTAVIFPDGVGAMKEFAALNQGKVLDHFFAGVNRTSVDQVLNSNVIIFLFNRSREQVMEMLSGRVWERENLNKYLLDARISTCHRIPLPGPTEVRRMLNYLRLYGNGEKRLKVNCALLGELSKMLTRKIAANYAESAKVPQYDPTVLQATDLKGTLWYLMNRFVNTGRPLDLEDCRDICRRGSDLPAVEQLNRMIGLKSVKSAMEDFLNLGRIQEKQELPDAGCRLDRETVIPEKKRINLHFVLVGRKGTGKTTVAKRLGEIFCEYGLLPTGHTVEVSPKELLASEHALSDAIERAMGGVLFIDEAYELAVPRASGVVAQILQDMNTYKGQLSIVMAGYPDGMEELMNSNEGLKGRFENNYIHIENYTHQELTEIFLLNAQKAGREVSPELRELLPTFIRNWYYDCRNVEWSNAREMENLLGSMEKKRKDPADKTLDVTMIPEHLLKYTTNEDERDAIERLKALIGLETVKNEIETFQLWNEFNMEPMPKHFIFIGPPGTGKTTVAKLLGKILKNAGVLENGHLVEAKPDKLIGQYVGSTASKAKAVFDSAMDGVMFIDEAYGLVPNSYAGEKETDFGAAVINLMLEYTDPGNQVPVCFICAGYKADMQLLMEYNPGLFSRFHEIEFESYSVGELMQILLKKLRERGYTAEPEYLEAARQRFTNRYEEISQYHNGRAVERHIRKSIERLLKRMKKMKMDKKEISQEELHTLTIADAVPEEEAL